MDPLSDVLSALRVSSVLSNRFEGRGAWALRFPAYQHIKFGTVLGGRFYLWLDGEGSPVELQTGDFYLMTTGKSYCSASDPGLPPGDGVAVIRASRGEDGVARYDGGGDLGAVSLAGGRFTFEDDVSQLLLRHLPALIRLPASSSGVSALPALLDLLRMESEGLHIGGEVARGSLAALALVHILRAWLATASQPAGWLGALSDPKINKALSAMHAQPGRRWTLDMLAGQAAMSRTAFAARFRRLVGQPPLEYLLDWRMTLARAALRQSSAPLSELAERLGYLSDTAFSIAFKRSTGVSPGRFRSRVRPSNRLQG
ncbi:AraC family transcriptional regulator [Pseudacidovorax intermedius]|uniref:AraC family transcriptional regulator n=1 Tax=Pseudacidovorax intermedius TaxID=433924 RepID=UPI0026EC6C83|nr:AraC family transcriptional regulator [Pseudacidovorax intermedius]